MEYKNVYEALAAVNRDIQDVEKNGFNSFHKFAYATIEEVYAVCREAMYKNGVVLVAGIVENEMTSTVTHQTETNNGKVTEKDKTCNYGTVVFNYQFYYGESHTEPIRWIGEAMDTGDKTYSKAISFAQKTFLLTFFNIPRVDANNTHDPDSYGNTGTATPHNSNSQESKFRKAKTFYWCLFGKENLNWIDKESQYKDVFKAFCAKCGATTYMKDWTWDMVEEMRMLLGDAGIKISYDTEITPKLLEAIKTNLTRYINVGGTK